MTDTALVSTIAVADLMFISNTISAQNYRALEIFTLAALIYFAIAFPVSLITSQSKQKYETPIKHPGPPLQALGDTP